MSEQQTFNFGDYGRATSFAGKDFLITKANQEAAAWLERFNEWPLFGQSPAFLLHAPSRAGKTHYLHVFAALSNGVVIKAGELAQHTHYLCAPLIIDDVHLVKNNEAAARRLFALINEHSMQGGGMLFATAELPRSWNVFADLISRLNAFARLYIHAPDKSMAEGLFLKLLHERQLQLGLSVQKWMLEHLPSSYQAIHDVVKAMDAWVAQNGGKIDITSAKRIFDDALHQSLPLS